MFRGYKNSIANYYPYYLKIGVKNDKEFVLKVGKNLDKINLNPKGNSALRYFWLDNKYFMKIEKIETEEEIETKKKIAEKIAAKNIEKKKEEEKKEE